ncbi:MAG: BLUF domain-containing protein [Pseudomonadota bacterium]
MLSLCYLSSAAVPFSPEALDALLARSRANNTRDGITGMLLYRDGDFLQVLEGPADAVRTTYRRISADPRHSRVLLIDESEIEQRAFGDWSMGFRRLAKNERPAGFVDFFDRRFDPTSVIDVHGEVYRYLESFRQLG